MSAACTRWILGVPMSAENGILQREKLRTFFPANCSKEDKQNLLVCFLLGYLASDGSPAARSKETEI